ncbi:hypothetical protein J4E90_005921 [Alternaria incomplexa]|uniref:uncharacterized protein n=1 Tax=Alternaria incomplexa TaxID=1187928 RepID=UPI00221F2977|nr:uncharacterized protein J4E90_005921 [Alternaria incomplexa]KAI4912517.1 hypothetical protein J4E90_005921 [Alternaria incomplexa]
MDLDWNSEYSWDLTKENSDPLNPEEIECWRMPWVRYIDKPYNRDRPSKEQQKIVARRDREQVREIASKLHVKLPRELRDEVYQYLVAEEDTFWFRQGLEGLSTASDEQYVKEPYKVFCPSYVGYEVACEAAERYYATNVFDAGTQSYHSYGDHPTKLPGLQYLMPQLVEDLFGLGILPYKFIRHLFIRIDLTDICPPMSINPEEPSRDELSDLEKLHNDLESGLSLIVEKSKLDVTVQIMPSEDEWHWGGEPDESDMEPADGDPYRIGFLNVERSLLNVLEAMRKSLYDLKYSGSSVTILCLMNVRRPPKDRRIRGLFHLTKEDWEKVSVHIMNRK